MSSSQEKAEVILMVIKRILKWLLIASITLAIIIGVIASYIDYKNKQDYTKKREEEDKKREEEEKKMYGSKLDRVRVISKTNQFI